MHGLLAPILDLLMQSIAIFMSMEKSANGTARLLLSIG